MSGFYTRDEERFHTLTHGAGAVVAAVGAAYLQVRAFSDGDVWRIVSMAIYGLTLVGLYTASTLYHGVRTARLKARLRVVDHSAIYLFIAGTYTPFLLVPLRGPWGWFLFGVAWGVAVAGVIYKLVALDRFPRLSTVLYLAMGWMGVLAIVPLAREVSPATLAWLGAGGLVYTGGALIYHMGRRWAHVVWHVFVLVGSVCHFIAIARL